MGNKFPCSLPYSQAQRMFGSLSKILSTLSQRVYRGEALLEENEDMWQPICVGPNWSFDSKVILIVSR